MFPTGLEAAAVALAALALRPLLRLALRPARPARPAAQSLPELADRREGAASAIPDPSQSKGHTMNLMKLAAAGWTAAEAALHKAADYLTAHSSPTTHAQIAQTLSEAKQGASDALAVGDSALGQVLEAATDDLVTLFNNGLQALGYSLGGPAAGQAVGAAEAFLKPYEIDMAHRFRDGLQRQLDALTLDALARMAGHPVTLPAAPAAATAPAAPVATGA